MILYKSAPLGEVIDADDKQHIVKGYASYFNNKPGAYAKTIKENGERVRYIYQHNMAQPLGKMVMLEEDDKGLKFEAQLANTTLMGVITENSVGILPMQKEFKGDYREITEVKLYEVSAVTLAANDQAKILDVKGSENKEEIIKRYDNLAKLIRKGNISDEMGYAIEAELLKLKSLFVSATLPSEEDTKPVDDSDKVYKYLIDKLK
jgi:HK97 family phage prohead protease